MNLERTDEHTEALIRELHNIVQNDRYPFTYERLRAGHKQLPTRPPDG
jgi:hypothetical protein